MVSVFIIPLACDKFNILFGAKFYNHQSEGIHVLHELPHHPVDAYQMNRSCHSAGELDLFTLQERMGEFEQALVDKELSALTENIKVFRNALSIRFLIITISLLFLANFHITHMQIPHPKSQSMTFTTFMPS